MSEEIKEILDYLKIENGTIGSELSYEETHLLLDYITNLQEENKKLKELCDKYEEEHKTTFEYWKHLIKEDYKTRIDKAIEYIDKHYWGIDGFGEIDKVKNILKGDNK